MTDENSTELISLYRKNAKVAHRQYAAVLNRIDAIRRMESKSNTFSFSQNHDFSISLLKAVYNELLTDDKAYSECMAWMRVEIQQLETNNNEFAISKSIENFRIQLKKEPENTAIYRALVKSIKHIGL
jgi:hypothetical protein